jgi:hypothetical protein
VPFTVSHVAAVLPLRADQVRRWLPTAPLEIGAMAPDAPSTVGALALRHDTHELTGAFTIDVAITALGCLVWAWVLRPVVADLLPDLAARWRPSPPRRPGQPVAALLWYVAAALGCLSHVVWDAFTHPGGASYQWVPLEGLDLRWFGPLQVASSVLGLAVLAGWSVRWWRTTPRQASHVYPRHAATGRWRALSAGAIVVVAACWAAAVRVLGSTSPHQLSVELGFGALSGALVGALAVAAVYRIFVLRPRPGAESAGGP